MSKRGKGMSWLCVGLRLVLTNCNSTGIFCTLNWASRTAISKDCIHYIGAQYIWTELPLDTEGQKVCCNLHADWTVISVKSVIPRSNAICSSRRHVRGHLVSLDSNQSTISPDSGLASYRRQTITWIYVDEGLLHHMASLGHNELTHLHLDKMAIVSQTTFSNAFLWMITHEYGLKFHWSLFPRVQSTILQHWVRWWLGADQATSHYLNQWWPIPPTYICSTGERWVKWWTVYHENCYTRSRHQGQG